MQSKLTKGLLFTWIPLLLFIIPGLVSALGSMSSQKATGVGLLSSLSWYYLSAFVMVAVAACEVYGVILLSGTFSKEQLLRGFIAAVSIGCGVLGVLFVIVSGALLVWMIRSGVVH